MEEKKYTLDTKLNKKDFESWEVREPITDMDKLKTALRTHVFNAEYFGVEYLVGVEDGYTEVLVDIKNKYAKQKCYTFDTFEEALNAHLIVNHPKKVVGDMIVELIVFGKEQK